MQKQQVISDIEGLLCLYGASVSVGRERGLSAHQTRVLLAIYYLQEIRLRGVTRKLTARHTYLWLSTVKNAVRYFVERGYIKPITAPKYYLQFTEVGLSILAGLIRDADRQKRILLDGPAPINKPKPRPNI
ncbi:hypothetical protein [Sabulibacter ruber]|uniref:hypothetical protein n=1 Tax=Sabulibacter ruber TaxID=2811901 RepID=UPI001A970C16|nr:hypothetical protein [Sabulibacter ruber]